jgi:hypothetical protein
MEVCSRLTWIGRTLTLFRLFGQKELYLDLGLAEDCTNVIL